MRNLFHEGLTVSALVRDEAENSAGKKGFIG